MKEAGLLAVVRPIPGTSMLCHSQWLAMVLLHSSTRNARTYTYLARNLSLTQRDWDCSVMYMRSGADQSEAK